MAGIPKGSATFFRLSPAEAAEAKCFAIRRGEVTGRADVVYHHPWVHFELERLDHALFPSVEFSSIMRGIRYGTGSPPPYVEPTEDATPFIRATDIKEGEILTAGLKYVSRHQPDSLKKCLLAGGELIIVRSGVNTGDCAVVPNALAGSYAAYDLIITFREGAVPTFVSFYLDAVIGRLQLNLVRGRAAQPHINADEVRELRIVLPPPRKQAEFVAAMEISRTERRRKLAQADDYLKSFDAVVLKELGLKTPPLESHAVYAIRFGNLGRRIDAYSNLSRFRRLFEVIQSGDYPVATFAELADRIFSGSTPLAKGDAYIAPPGGVRFIRSGEITDDGRVADQSDVHIKLEVHQELMRRSQLIKNDLLIAIVGATIGQTGVYHGDELANINQAIAAVRLKDGVLPDYANIYLRSLVGQSLLDYFKRPVARANINLEEVGEIPVVVAPIQVQERLVSKFDEYRNEARRLRADADAEWQAAKRWFEEQLLGGPRA